MTRQIKNRNLNLFFRPSTRNLNFLQSKFSTNLTLFVFVFQECVGFFVPGASSRISRADVARLYISFSSCHEIYSFILIKKYSQETCQVFTNHDFNLLIVLIQFHARKHHFVHLNFLHETLNIHYELLFRFMLASIEKSEHHAKQLAIAV